MALTPDEFDEICKATCPHCRGGLVPTRRELTGEWVHQKGSSGAFMMSICWANGFRQSRFAPIADEVSSG